MKEHRMAMELHSLDELGRKELARRVSEMQRKHAMAVMTLTTQEERLAYVQGIPADVSAPSCPLNSARPPRIEHPVDCLLNSMLFVSFPTPPAPHLCCFFFEGGGRGFPRAVGMVRVSTSPLPCRLIHLSCTTRSTRAY